MPVTRRGTASTPEQASTKASAPHKDLTSHSQTHQASKQSTSSQPQQQSAAKRKASTIATPCKISTVSSPTKAGRKQLKVVSEQIKNLAPSKRHKGDPAEDEDGENAAKPIEADLASRAGSLGTSQALGCHIKEPPVLQSPSRPPLIPRTPATADRTGRNPGGLLRQQSILKPCALAPTTEQDWFDPKRPEKVAQVKGVLHTSYVPEEEEPLGRFEQTEALRECISSSISSRSGTSIYVSGLPGTGKTLTVHAVARACAREATSATPVLLSINCMTLQAPSQVFRRILDGLNAPQPADCQGDVFICPGPQPGGATEGPQAALEGLKKALEQASEAPGPRRLSTPCKGRRGRGMAVVILDEMDQLLSQDHSVLYDLFRLPQAPNSRLILIGIANSIDLTERALPRLQALGCRPTLVTFPSYSSLQLECLLQQRLQALPGTVFQLQAVRLAAKKMASRSGDMRRLLDACAAAVDLIVQEASEQQPEQNKGDGAMSEAAAAPAPQPKLVGIAPMFRAISQLQGGSAGSSVMVTAVKGLPTQQQLLLCAATSLLGTDGPPPGISTPPTSFKQRCSSLGFNSPISVSKQRRLSFGSDNVRTPGRINMSRPSSTSDSSRLSGGTRQRDCQLGQLHTSYFGLCKKVSVKPLAPSEVTAACSTLADMGFLDLGHASEERQRRVTLRIAVEDVALGLQDVRLFSDCLPVPE